ncbi:unnamed protein product [Phaedon cochleariae]|uniref:Exuperantia SAM-like domain-containing protein n=1 Tax=Phaedon cochleariae TaxID=80249 RepID=A0A9N9SJ00_PHACE|nr:unnamed protein product [Phaedon cochleariae]
MVQNESSNSGDESVVPAVPENPAKGIDTGKYRLVGWGIDTTGRRLIDEIVQLAAYTPDSQFSQYIMPFADLNPVYSRRHGIRVVNAIRYRRLRDLNTHQFVKTKSEISALQDFLQWLETIKGDDVDGLVLIYYEIRKASPGMLLESLRRYQLIERFSKVVKGFVNGFNIAQGKCANTTKSFNLRVMSKVLLNHEDENFNSAVDRARASFDIAVHLAQGERVELEGEGKPTGECSGKESQIVDFVCPYANPIDAEEEEIAVFKILLERQNTFRPVFGALLRASRLERQHASHLRRLLAENNINYDQLKTAYDSEAKEGLEKVIKSELFTPYKMNRLRWLKFYSMSCPLSPKVANANEKDREELLEILDCFFDPEKKAVQPKFQQRGGGAGGGAYPYYPRKRNNRPPQNRKRSGASEGDNQTSESGSPRSEQDAAAAQVKEEPESTVTGVKEETESAAQQATATAQ